MSSSLAVSVRLRLAFFSGNRCAFPNCRQELATADTPTSAGAVIGEAAHIVGEKLGSQRHDPAYPSEKLNSVVNLIYLCPTHHTQIDKPGNGFTADAIHQWKSDHEQKVKQALDDAMADVSFAELEMVTTALLENAPTFDGDFSVTPPLKKIEKNGLSRAVAFLISSGLAKSEEVRSFIERLATIVPGFDARLISGFRKRYNQLVSTGANGDDLFLAMQAFASRQSADPTLQAAGLAVLSHLFETCDVFEK